MVIHARADFLDGVDRPALSGAVEFQNLFLPLQIVLPAVAGCTGVGNRPLTGLCFSPEHLWSKLGEIIAPMTAWCALGNQSPLALPPAQGGDRDTKHPGRLTNVHKTLHA